jgi:glycosyltransferase involved in cell wall biosynthesis
MIEDREMGPAIREVLSWCDGIAVFSRGALQRLAREGHVLAGKSRIIPNGVSLPGNGEVGRFSRAVPCDGIVFVGVGGIREVKGLSWLAENLSALRKSGLDIHYVHAGPVLEKEEGARFLRICREEPWIHYAGEVPHEQVFSFLRLGDVFVSASRSEGMPHAVREAMLAGLPCLLSDIEGHRALARSGREAIFFGDAADFAAKATTLAGDSGLRERLKKGAKERVERMCLNGKEIDAYLHFFSDLVKKHGNRPFSLPGRRTTADRFRR